MWLSFSLLNFLQFSNQHVFHIKYTCLFYNCDIYYIYYFTWTCGYAISVAASTILKF